jgi:hypothetical protein
MVDVNQNQVSLKQSLKVISKVLNFEIRYLKNKIDLHNKQANVLIESKTKSDYKLEYKGYEQKGEFSCTQEIVLDLVSQVFHPEHQHNVKKKGGTPMQIATWLEEEGGPALKSLELLKNDLKTESIESRILFGNRIECTFCEGFLFLTDDLNLKLANVIPFNSKSKIHNL